MVSSVAATAGPINQANLSDKSCGLANKCLAKRASTEPTNPTYEHVEEMELAQQVQYMPEEIRRLWYITRKNPFDRQSEYMIGYHFDVGMKASSSGGQVFPPNTTQALFWYKRAAAKGHTTAQMNLGVLYETGHQKVTATNLAAGIQWYYRAAMGGNAAAQFALGRLFWTGKGVPLNYEVAFAFFMKAALKDHTMAQTNVGAMLMNGNGVAADATRARKWLQMATTKSNAVAHHNLGVMYENGIGGPIDMAQARKHFEAALDPSMNYTVTSALSSQLRLNRDPLVFT